MTSDDDKDNPWRLFKELPMMKLLENQTINSEVIMENKDKIYDLVLKHARKGDVAEPLVFIYTFLFYYAKMAINPESGFNISRQNIVDLYTAFHQILIKDIMKYDFKSSPPSMYDSHRHRHRHHRRITVLTKIPTTTNKPTNESNLD